MTAKLGGFSVVADSIPVGCNGLNIYIDSYNNNVKVHSVNNTYTHMCDAGGYDVTLAYTDIFGEGPRSDERSVVVKVVVDAALLEAEAVTKEKLSLALQQSVDDTAQNVQDIAALATRMDTAEIDIDTNAGTITALTQRVGDDEADIAAVQLQANNISSTVFDGQGTSRIDQNANGINAIVTNLNDSTLARSYTAIQVMQDGIASKVSMGDVTSYFQQTHQGFLIEGSLIHISGNTVFDNGVITADMLQAGCITADAIYQAGYKVKNILFSTGTFRVPTDSGSRYYYAYERVPIPNEASYSQSICNAYAISRSDGTRVNIDKVEYQTGEVMVCITGGVVVDSQGSMAWSGPNPNNPRIPAYYDIPYRSISVLN